MSNNISFKGNVWKTTNIIDASLINKLVESYQISYLEAVFLCNRILCDDSGNIDEFLNCRISSYINNDNLVDLKKTIDRIKIAIQNKEKIAILGDYDVDGITSTSMFVKLFQAYDIDYVCKIPNRSDGYGHNKKTVSNLSASLVLMLDCGSSSEDEFENLGKDICIIDHHQTSKNPSVFSFVNPYRNDVDPRGQENFIGLCTAGLCFIVIFHLMKILKDKKFDFKSLLDLVALGTIADCMELTNLNRAYVIYGLKLISLQKRLGMKFLCDNLSSGKITASQAAFYICPCINAAGRVASSDIALKLMCTEDAEEAYKLSKTLIALNERRKLLEQKSMDQIMPSIEKSNCIIVENEEFHPGIVGILSGRIKEKFKCPAFVLYKKGDLWKGSARSVKKINIGSVIHSSVLKGFAISGGGHAMAGGVVVHESKYDDWKKFMNDNIKFNEDSESVLEADCTMTLKAVYSNSVMKISPFGIGNIAPKVLVNRIWVESALIYKEHVKIVFNENGFKCSIFAFRWFELFDLIPIKGFVDIIVNVNEDNKIFILDIRKSDNINIDN